LHSHTFFADTSATLPKVRRCSVVRTRYPPASTSQLRQSLLCPPHYFDVADQKNLHVEWFPGVRV